MRLRLLPVELAVARFQASDEVPEWALQSPFFSATRTNRELSLVCLQHLVPPSVPQAGPFRALEVDGPLDFALTGILSALLAPLAEAHVSIFALSTFDTDYVLVRAESLAGAITALEAAGHEILNP